jgi:hypothetical protein
MRRISGRAAGPARVPAVTRWCGPDVWRAARLLMEQHGSEAAARAADQICELASEGDVAGAITWRAVLQAVEELSRGRRNGESLN